MTMHSSAARAAVIPFAALAVLALSAAPALAQWAYSVEQDDHGLEYAKVSVKDTAGTASIYTECSKGLGTGLALILRASENMIAQYGGQTGQILYRNDAGDEALASVDYKPGEGILTLAAPDREEIETAWALFGKAGEAVTVRFTFPPFPQVYEVAFPAEGATQALADLDAYCQ